MKNNMKTYKVINNFDNNVIYVTTAMDQSATKRYFERYLTNAEYLTVVSLSHDVYPTLKLKEAVEYISENWKFERQRYTSHEIDFPILLDKAILKEIEEVDGRYITIKSHFFDEDGLQKELAVMWHLMTVISEESNRQLKLSYAQRLNRVSLLIKSAKQGEYPDIKIKKCSMGIHITSTLKVREIEIITFEKINK